MSAREALDDTVIPITHSVLCASALAERICLSYDLPGEIQCELLNRGQNDVYRVRLGEVQYACRVWRAGLRTEDQIAYETEFLAFLSENDVPVSTALPTRDGKRHVPVRAPEGLRYFSLFEWAQGAPFAQRPDPRSAARIGAVMGRLHNVAAGFHHSPVRYVDAPRQLREQLPALLRLVAHRPENGPLYSEAAEAVAASLDALDDGKVPKGPTHGDFHVLNAFVDGERVLLLDFDTCGVDHFAADIGSFFWATDYLQAAVCGHCRSTLNGFDASINDAFLEGYETERRLLADERERMPLFYAAKELCYLTGFAAAVEELGHSPMLKRSLDWFAERTRLTIDSPGLL